MRELKFRAWDKEKKKWIHKPFAIIGETTVFEMLRYYSIEDFNDIIVMQFTGALDRRGKEIYEGDIVERTWNKWKDDSDEHYYDKATGTVSWDKWGLGCWQIETIKSSEDESFPFECPDGPLYQLEELEVIGNIFESPELLKEENNETKNN